MHDWPSFVIGAGAGAVFALLLVGIYIAPDNWQWKKRRPADKDGM